jgi:hypothetical protein
MAFHLALYYASLAGNAALTQLNALGDQVIAPAANGYLVPPVINKVMAVSGVGGLLIRAQINSASIRDFTPFDCAPINNGAVVAIPAAFQDFRSQPLPLLTNEELDAFILNSGAGPTKTLVAVWFCDGPVTPVKGRVFTVHWTSGNALAAADAWSSITPVLDNGLPSGTFALVGSRLESATGQFHRFIPKGGNPYRPGTFCTQVSTGSIGDQFRYGNCGEWLRFTNTTLPTIEEFALAADATQQGYLDLIQVA